MNSAAECLHSVNFTEQFKAHFYNSLELTLRTVLVIDDDPETKRLLDGELVHLDYNFLFTSRRDQSLGSLLNGSYSLIIYGLCPPSSTVFSFLRNLRERTTGTPIVLLTPPEMVPAAKVALDFGIESYIVKPVHASALELLLDRTLKGER